METLQKFNKMLVEKNTVINLTGHKTEEESWQKNIADSLLFIHEFKNLGAAEVLDIGAGGGLPGIPLAIECPNLRITMIDSVNKKIEFIKQAIKELCISNAAAFHVRAEDFVKSSRGEFDIVTARAFAPLPVLLEYAMGFLKVGGYVYAFKGQNYINEIAAAGNALRLLSAKIERIEERLDEGIARFLIIIKKVAETEKKFPRKNNLPRLSPL